MRRLACIAAISCVGGMKVSAQSSTIRGTASVVLQMMDTSQGRSLPGTVSIPALHLDIPVSAGLDTLHALPEGSWTLRVRAIGYEPRTVVVEAHASGFGSAIVTIRMIPLAQTLAAVHVVAERDQRVLDDIDERMRVASGTLIRAGDPFLATATESSDALRAGRGFRWKSPTDVEARGRCKSAKSNLPSPRERSTTEVAVYLDGERLRGGLETLNNIIRPDDILAIEAYPEVLSAPFLWRTADACAVVAFWTKHRVES